jgi:ribosomal protein S18 acetylase RimI-like enzyme
MLASKSPALMNAFINLSNVYVINLDSKHVNALLNMNAQTENKLPNIWSNGILQQTLNACLDKTNSQYIVYISCMDATTLNTTDDKIDDAEENKILACSVWQILYQSKVDLDLELLYLQVDKNHQQQGIAKQHLSMVLKNFKQGNLNNVTINLEVRASNLPAIKLYTNLGFACTGLRKNYYTEPVENALLMNLKI